MRPGAGKAKGTLSHGTQITRVPVPLGPLPKHWNGPLAENLWAWVGRRRMIASLGCGELSAVSSVRVIVRRTVTLMATQKIPYIPEVLSLLLSICVAGCATTAQQATGSATNYFDCDVPPGKFSQWEQTVISKGISVSGTIQVLEVREHPKWGPVASVLLVGEENLPAVGLQVIPYKDSPTASLSMKAPGVEGGRFTLATRSWEGKMIPFTLQLSDAGSLTVNLDGVSRTMSVNSFHLKRVSLACSTGQFKFRDVQISGR